MIKVSFQPTQRAFLKQVLVFFVIILALIPVVKAEEKSWYEIDGIRVRRGQINNDITIYTWKTNIEGIFCPLK